MGTTILDLALLVVTWLGAVGGGASGDPSVVLWAWDRPEDLRFLAPGEATVAYLAATVTIADDGVTVVPRRGGLALHGDVERLPVIRIEVARHPEPDLDVDRLAEVAAIIDDLAPTPAAPRLQLDFDASLSQRRFYGDLVQRLRRTRPAPHEISITALGSWCLGDRWVSALSVDFAVAMLFRMGPEGPSVRTTTSESGFAEPLCRNRVGLATDEPWVLPQDAVEIWFFHPAAWTQDAWESTRLRLREEVRK